MSVASTSTNPPPTASPVSSEAEIPEGSAGAEKRATPPPGVVFMDETEFAPPPGAQERKTEPGAKRPVGRPPDPPEVKAQKEAARNARETMGDLFHDEPRAAEEADPGANGSIPPTPEALPKKERMSRGKQFESLAQIICLNQYALMGMLFDPVESNPLIRAEVTTNGQKDIVFVHGQQGLDMHEQLKAAWVEYLKSKDVTEISPGWVLVMSQATYASAVVSQPKSAEKMRGYFGKLRELWRSWRK